jgi:hypothetical protein
MPEEKEASSKEKKMTMNDVNNVKKPGKPPEIRNRFLLENIGIMDIQVIADEMGVHNRTIYRDIDELKASGEWDKWIENELLRLHRKSTITDTAKYKELAKLRARSIVQKAEVKTDGITRYEFVVVKPDGKSTSNVEPPPDTVDSSRE